MRWDVIDIPGTGRSGAYGIFRVVGYSEEEDGSMAAAYGDSYVAAVEFSMPLRAMSLVGYDNASRSGSSTGPISCRFAEKKLRSAWAAELRLRSRARENALDGLRWRRPLLIG